MLCFFADGNIYGLAFDWIANVVYTVSLRGHVIACSTMCTIHLAGNCSPQGIAVWGDRIYWTNHFTFKIESMDKNGEDRRTLNTGSYHLYHLAV